MCLNLHRKYIHVAIPPETVDLHPLDRRESSRLMHDPSKKFHALWQTVVVRKLG